MGSLARKMACANKSRKQTRSLTTPYTKVCESDVTDPGLYCDCHGTLFSYNFERNTLLVDYLNAQYAVGREVRLISTDTMGVYDKIANIGLHPRIVRTLTDKRAFYNSVLEELIDDDPVLLKACKLHDPKDEAFKTQMRKYLETAPRAPEPPL